VDTAAAKALGLGPFTTDDSAEAEADLRRYPLLTGIEKTVSSVLQHVLSFGK